MSLKLTFPRSHDLEDLRPVYNDFREVHPDVYEEWLQHRLESFGKPLDPQTFDKPNPVVIRIHRKVKDYLATRVECVGSGGLLSGVSDFSDFMEEEVRDRFAKSKGVD